MFDTNYMFDLYHVTLTLGQLQRLTNMNHECGCHQHHLPYGVFKQQSAYYIIAYLALAFELDLWSTLPFHPYRDNHVFNYDQAPIINS